MDEPDHLESLEPQELKQMVSSIRNIEKAMGDGIKRPNASEKKNSEVVLKRMIAKLPIKKGDIQVLTILLCYEALKVSLGSFGI